MWHPPDDPQIFGAMELDARPALAFIARAARAGHHVTITHLVGRAVSHTIEAVPDLNVRIRRGWARPRPSIDVFFVTAVGGGHDLSGVKIVDVPSKPAIALGTELAERSRAMKRGADRDFARTKRVMERMPGALLRVAVELVTLVTEELQLDLPALALHRAPFGSAMVTSLGMFGIPHGFAPLSRMYDVPLIVLVGEVSPRPVVVEGRVEAREMLPITATIDHRYVDGWHIAQAMTAFREYLAAPERFEPSFARDADSVASARPSTR
jgi:pyruvate dehydrogenase E2 component (dihydrolipoamide acetyltransferase)